MWKGSMKGDQKTFHIDRRIIKINTLNKCTMQFLSCCVNPLVLFLNRPDDIYHVTIMPCYDKKLEASREDFYNDIYRTRDVDCVISTSKLIQMIRILEPNANESR